MVFRRETFSNGRSVIYTDAINNAMHINNPDVDMVEIATDPELGKSCLDILSKHLLGKQETHNLCKLSLESLPHKLKQLFLSLGCSMDAEEYKTINDFVMTQANILAQLLPKKALWFRLFCTNGDVPYYYWHLESHGTLHTISTFSHYPETTTQWIPFTACNMPKFSNVHNRGYSGHKARSFNSIDHNQVRHMGLNNIVVFRGCSKSEIPNKGLLHRGAPIFGNRPRVSFLIGAN